MKGTCPVCGRDFDTDGRLTPTHMVTADGHKRRCAGSSELLTVSRAEAAGPQLESTAGADTTARLRAQLEGRA